jgi:hypothetical protein
MFSNIIEQGVPKVSTPCFASGDRSLQELPAPGVLPYI